MTEVMVKPPIDIGALKTAIANASNLDRLAAALNKAAAEIKAQDSDMRLTDVVDLSDLAVFSDVGPSDTAEIMSYDDSGSILVVLAGEFKVRPEFGKYRVWDRENENYASDDDSDDSCEYDTVTIASADIGEIACQQDRCISEFEVHHADGREWFHEIVYSDDGCIEDADGDMFDYEPGIRQGEKKSFD